MLRIMREKSDRIKGKRIIYQLVPKLEETVQLIDDEDGCFIYSRRRKNCIRKSTVELSQKVGHILRRGTTEQNWEEESVTSEEGDFTGFESEIEYFEGSDFHGFGALDILAAHQKVLELQICPDESETCHDFFENDFSVADVSTISCSEFSETEAGIATSIQEPETFLDCDRMPPSEPPIEATAGAHEVTYIETVVTDNTAGSCRCAVCNVKFTSMYCLVEHAFTHVPETDAPQNVCISCGEVFENHVSFTIHPCRIFSVVICKPEAQLLATNQIICSYCLEHVETGYLLVEHVFSHIDNVNPPAHVCPYCGNVLPEQLMLQEHVYGENPGELSTLSLWSLQNRNSDNRGKQLSCREMSWHSRKDVSSLGCSLCGKEFKRTAHLEQHIRCHTQERPFNCRICDKSFSRKDYLRVHEKCHKGVRSHVCDVCDRGFVRLATLRVHQLLHTGERPFKCDECGRTFLQISHLKGHQRSHSGVKAFSCHICDKKFTRAQTVKEHMLIHTGEKPHKCKVCGNAFRSRDGMRSHMRIHTGKKSFICSSCGKKFAHLNSLKRHNLTHTDERPFACEICGIAYRDYGTLKRHKYRHTG